VQSIIFPSAVLPVAPVIGLGVVVALAPEERTFTALHSAVLRGAIGAGIAERLTVGAEVVVAVTVRVPGVLAPRHDWLYARHVGLRGHDTTALGVLPRVLGVPERFQRLGCCSFLGGCCSFLGGCSRCSFALAREFN